MHWICWYLGKTTRKGFPQRFTFLCNEMSGCIQIVLPFHWKPSSVFPGSPKAPTRKFFLKNFDPDHCYNDMVYSRSGPVFSALAKRVCSFLILAQDRRPMWKTWAILLTTPSLWRRGVDSTCVWFCLFLIYSGSRTTCWYWYWYCACCADTIAEEFGVVGLPCRRGGLRMIFSSQDLSARFTARNQQADSNITPSLLCLRRRQMHTDCTCTNSEFPSLLINAI